MIKEQILKDILKSEPKTYLHFGDGDYYFLTKQAIGSATPGKRALSKPYEHMNMQPFIDGVLKNDYICMEYYETEMIKNFHSIYPDRKIDFDLTQIYQLMAEKWFLGLDTKIGLIGAWEKLELIKTMMDSLEYKKYLGIYEFEYIGVPQKFIADNFEENIQNVKAQLLQAKSKIFLFGIGHAKCGMAWHFKRFHNAVYIDVGAGIDMLAGIYDYQRPFGGLWTNYRLHNFNYGKLDLMYFQSRSSDIWLD